MEIWWKGNKLYIRNQIVIYMSTICKHCGKPCPEGRTFCDTDLNSWPVMLTVIQARQQHQDQGKPSEDTSRARVAETRMLKDAWKDNRLGFDKTLASWY